MSDLIQTVEVSSDNDIKIIEIDEDPSLVESKYLNEINVTSGDDIQIIEIIKNKEPDIIEIATAGVIPDHEIDDNLNRIRFQKPDRTWGEWIEFGGESSIDWTEDQEGDYYIHPNNIQKLDGGSFT